MIKSYQNFSEDIEQRRQAMKQRSSQQLQKFKARTAGAQQERQADAADRENMKKEIDGEEAEAPDEEPEQQDNPVGQKFELKPVKGDDSE